MRFLFIGIGFLHPYVSPPTPAPMQSYHEIFFYNVHQYCWELHKPSLANTMTSIVMNDDLAVMTKQLVKQQTGDNRATRSQSLLPQQKMAAI